jgi:hypothetical protein
MKKLVVAVSIIGLFGAATASHLCAASSPEPTIYVVQKGDTLWGISDRFFKDPFFWPNLWSRNPAIGNPHFIFPGQKLRILSDRIEVVTVETPPSPVAVTTTLPPVEYEPIQEKTFSVTGGEGFITEDDLAGVGRIVATNHDRVVVGATDTVYTNIGANHGARKGDRFSIFSKQEVVTHPTRRFTVGYKIIPVGTLELTELTATGSRAGIIMSFREISSGAILLPWRDGRREIPLKATNRSLSGIILDSLSGNKAVGVGNVVYLDLGKSQGIEVGNMLYVVRTVLPDREFRGAVTLPQEVLGALIIVGVGRDTSTALIIKNAETIFLGDKVVTVLPE